MKQYTWPEPQRQTAFPIAAAGYPFIFTSAFVTAIFALIGFAGAALTFLFITIFICAFFRDPDRVTPTGDGVVVSPADGKVIKTVLVGNSPFSDEKQLKISIFMNVFNVHVNRIPHEGTITRITYNPGKFFNASLDKASLDNEQNAILLETAEGYKIGFIQIAGLVARRIICNIEEGDTLKRGQRFGMICFGSRLDVFMPVDVRQNVSVGDKVSAGTSILGYLR